MVIIGIGITEEERNAIELVLNLTIEGEGSEIEANTKKVLRRVIFAYDRAYAKMLEKEGK